MTRRPHTERDALALRPIEAGDDAALAGVIRAVMPEFGASGAGFAILDAEVDAMFASYARPKCAYFVVTSHGRVVGGAGIAPLEGGDGETCELRKMYFLPEVRGRGMGVALLARCLSAARDLGFATCYLETLTGMTAAQGLYEKFGFRRLEQPCGATGHFGCDRWYALDLNRPRPVEFAASSNHDGHAHP
jgi:putative acetyltransferase